MLQFKALVLAAPLVSFGYESACRADNLYFPSISKLASSISFYSGTNTDAQEDKHESRRIGLIGVTIRV